MNMLAPVTRDEYWELARRYGPAIAAVPMATRSQNRRHWVHPQDLAALYELLGIEAHTPNRRQEEEVHA